MSSQSVFVNMSRQDGDKDARMVPNDLARPAASDDVHIDQCSLMFFSECFLAIILLQITAIVGQKSLFPKNLTFGDLW